LLFEGCPPEKAEGLVKALNDPRRFGAPCPVPSLSLDHPAFSTDMWRGPAWININYLILRGLKRRGRAKEAEDLGRKMAGMVLKHYLRAGVLFEFYDALDQRLPEACDRKGACPPTYHPRKKISCIRDYHWTAALTFRLLWDQTEAKA
jgi:neutral trehalase